MDQNRSRDNHHVYVNQSWIQRESWKLFRRSLKCFLLLKTFSKETIRTSQEAYRSASGIMDGTSPFSSPPPSPPSPWHRPRESGIIGHAKPLSARRIERVPAWRKEILGLIGSFLISSVSLLFPIASIPFPTSYRCCKNCTRCCTSTRIQRISDIKFDTIISSLWDRIKFIFLLIAVSILFNSTTKN